MTKWLIHCGNILADKQFNESKLADEGIEKVKGKRPDPGKSRDNDGSCY
jgi:hypothetical protein